MNYYIVQKNKVKKFKNKENFILSVKKVVQSFPEQVKTEMFDKPYYKDLYKSLQLNKVYQVNTNSLRLFEDFVDDIYFLDEEDYLKWQERKEKENEQNHINESDN